MQKEIQKRLVIINYIIIHKAFLLQYRKFDLKLAI